MLLRSIAVSVMFFTILPGFWYFSSVHKSGKLLLINQLAFGINLAQFNTPVPS